MDKGDQLGFEILRSVKGDKVIINGETMIVDQRYADYDASQPISVLRGSKDGNRYTVQVDIESDQNQSNYIKEVVMSKNNSMMWDDVGSFNVIDKTNAPTRPTQTHLKRLCEEVKSK